MLAPTAREHCSRAELARVLPEGSGQLVAPPSLIGAPRPADPRSPPPHFPPVSSADSLASSPHHIPAMALALQLLPLLLWGVQGDPGGKLSLGNQHERVSLDGRPGDRVNLSCAGVSHPIRWVWAPSFPTCKGLPKGRRRILWASASGTPAVSAVQPFTGRLRALDHPGIRRLELLLSAGDSGIFICRGRHEDESHTVLHVLGDAADCPGPGPGLGAVHPLLLTLLLGAGLLLGLGALGAVWWQRR